MRDSQIIVQCHGALPPFLGLRLNYCIFQMVYDASREKIDNIYLQKINIHYCLDSSLHHAIYRCIMIHQGQYIDTSTCCIVAILTHTHTLTHVH